MATLASKLAHWTLQQSYEKLPAETVHEVERRVIDSIGCGRLERTTTLAESS